jgi:purine-nucleoside phosphorylase
MKRGLLGIDMETSILYSMAAQNGIEALSVLVVSDNLITNEFLSADEREEIGHDGIKFVLEIA